MTRRGARTAVAMLIVAIGSSGGARPAFAHAELIGSEPVADSVLSLEPAEIVLTFTEPVDVLQESVRLIAADGSPVTLGPVNQQRGADTMTAAIPEPLANGSYVVAWEAVSADSHPIRGAFVFAVGAPSAEAGSLVSDVLTDADTGKSANALLAIGRFLSFVGVLAFIGTAALVAALTPSQLAERRTGDVLTVAGILGIVGTGLMLSAQADAIGISHLDWAAVIGTRSGRWWLIRLIAIAIATLLIRFRHMLTYRLLRYVGAILSIAMLGVVAAGGHAVSGRNVFAGYVATVEHLVAGATWVGALVLLAIIVPAGERWDVAPRVSTVALFSVVVLSVSGAINAWRQIGSFDSLTESSYGRWLIVKLGIVAIVLGFAAVSRYTLSRSDTAEPQTTPNTAANLSAASATSTTHHSTRLVRTVTAEVIGIVLILVCTAGLTGATPPSAQAADTPANASATATQGDLVAQIDLLPAVTGGTTLHVTILTTPANPEPAAEITVEAELPEQQLGPLTISAVMAGPNHVTTDQANFPIPGNWVITATARFGDFDQVIFTTTITVTDP